MFEVSKVDHCHRLGKIPHVAVVDPSQLDSPYRGR
jgi:hypothetical protein